MIYLIGVDHQVQHQKNTQISMVFAFYLSKKIKELNIKFISEEWFEDLLNKNNVKSTVPQDVANKQKIEHVFCDPDKNERKRIGWFSKKDDYLREQYWLTKIKGETNGNIIFVCGSDHLESFNKLLLNNGFKSEILPKKFDVITYVKSQNKDI